MPGLGIVLCLGLLGGNGAEPHPNSVSYLNVDFVDGRMEVEWQIQVRTIAEVPGLWPVANADHAEPQLLLAAWPQLKTYLDEGMWFGIDAQTWQPDFQDFELSAGHDQILVRASRAATPVSDGFSIEFTQFVDDGNPGHRMYIEVVGRTPEPQRYVLSTDIRARDFGTPPTALERLWQSVRFGWEHVLGGHDHLAFLLALMFGVATGWSLVAAVTAFTLAHSVTLGIAAAGWYLPSAAWVEPGITISILATLWWHLARGEGAGRAWVPAFVFGLLHGFGFAGVFRDFSRGDSLLMPLFGFNLGVELGQLTFLAAVLGAWLLLRLFLAAQHRKAARNLAGVALGAYTFWLCGNTAADQWGWSLDRLPAAWEGILGSLAAAALLLLLLARRRAPDGTPLAAMAAQSLVLMMLYDTGRWIGGG